MKLILLFLCYSPKEKYDIHIDVPALPTYQEAEKSKPKEKRKSERHAIANPKFEIPKDEPVSQLTSNVVIKPQNIL